jgi:hypothetical protein
LAAGRRGSASAALAAIEAHQANHEITAERLARQGHAHQERSKNHFAFH